MNARDPKLPLQKSRQPTAKFFQMYPWLMRAYLPRYCAPRPGRNDLQVHLLRSKHHLNQPR